MIFLDYKLDRMKTLYYLIEKYYLIMVCLIYNIKIKLIIIISWSISFFTRAKNRN